MFTTLGPGFGIANIIVPKGGPKAISASLDFSNVAEISIDGQQVIDTGKIEYIQGVFIDNVDNANALTLEIKGLGQRLVVPPQSQGYFAIMVTNPPKMVARTTQVANLVIPVFFYNVPIQSAVWSGV